MRLIHISDLHLGLVLNGFDMAEDQWYILGEIERIIAKEDADGVIIAGDIYDKQNPPADAVVMFSRFIEHISRMGKNIYMISGNHDSAERINYGKEVFCNSGVYISDLYDGHIEPVKVSDEFGDVFIWLLPFVKPVHIRRAFPNAKIDSYNDALKTAVETLDIDPSQRNVIITHQFVTGAATCDSDCQLSVIVGTTEEISADIFSQFDYTALGHLHIPQNVTDRIRYCGSPLKYSFSEEKKEKSVTVIDLAEKGNLTVRTVPLKPLHDLKRLSGTFDFVRHPDNVPDIRTDDYIEVILNEENDIPDAMSILRSVYPNIMKLTYNNSRTYNESNMVFGEADESKSPLELFEEFYEMMNGSSVSEQQREVMSALINEIWSENETA